MDINDSYVQWNDKFNLGIKLIDAQHQKFVQTLQSLYTALRHEDPLAIDQVMVDLNDYVSLHFKTEEDLFKQYAYPDRRMHVAAHNFLRQEIAACKANNAYDKLAMGQKLLDLLEGWLINHLITLDKKYAPFLLANGVK